MGPTRKVGEVLIAFFKAGVVRGRVAVVESVGVDVVIFALVVFDAEDLSEVVYITTAVEHVGPNLAAHVSWWGDASFWLNLSLWSCEDKVVGWTDRMDLVDLL